MVFRYDVCLEEYMDLSSRSISGSKSEDVEPMRSTERRGSQKKKNLNNNLTYSSIQQITEFATTLLIHRIHVLTILMASYI